VTNKRPWLALGLTLRERLDLLLTAVEARGWKLVRLEPPTWTGRSMSNPLTRTIWISPAVWLPAEDGSPRATPVMIFALVRELAVIDQYGTDRICAIAQFVGLPCDPTRTQRRIDTEAEETAARYVIQRRLTAGSKLATEQPEIARAVLDRAKQILLEEGLWPDGRPTA